ncbi:MAG: FIST C-terminal domain-containing protein [Dehalococcoidia bacterium]|nr:FIST C-terminal domain-containing protein [Dehalococcoidia bacterium]MCK4263266.1 FIST C-terminal domain-containing protein [Dehalococcoidia bacterium]MCK4581144.1 FIST C-terminal domain-containing protein [Dehalococcoidia bacterium]
MKAGIGISPLADSTRAGREAATEAVKASGQPALTLLFTTDSYEQEAVLRAVKETVGDSKLVGFCAGAVIARDGVFQQAVGVATLGGDELQVRTALQGGLDADPYGAGRQAGEALLAGGIEKGLVISLPDSFPANIYEVTRGLYSTMGPDFAYIGGGAGDSLKFVKTYQMTEEGVGSKTLAAALVDGLQVKTGIGHGWTPEGDLMVITRAKGKRVYEIDARPAFDVYSERLGGIVRNRFFEFGMKHPFGFPDASRNYLIRDPLATNDDKSIDFVTEVPANAVATVMRGSTTQLIEVAASVAKKAAEGIAEPQLVLVFDCISRYVLMGQEFSKELAAIGESAGKELPLLGALTFGEIGSYVDVPLLHNKTVAVAVLGSEKGERRE